MEELSYHISKAWKKNSSFFYIFIVFLFCELTYLTSVEGTTEKEWYECINYVYVFLWSLPSLSLLCYVLFMRAYMPKAKKGTFGIAFYIINAKEKQYESICKKFVEKFQKSLNSTNGKFSIIIIDDYHSQKYFSILSQPIADTNGEEQAKLLRKRRCMGAIFIDCDNGGEGEELFCKMTMEFGITHPEIPAYIRDFLLKDISAAFAPLREIDIAKISQTKDFSSHSFALDIVYKYILASTSYHCGHFFDALELLEDIEHNLLQTTSLPPSVVPIKNILEDRLATCYKTIAQYEYELYCQDKNKEHLSAVLDAIGNVHCKNVYGADTKILEGICIFVLNRDVKGAIACMNAFSNKDTIVKYNKVFLMLYEQCTATLIFRIYNLYKNFGDLPNHAREQIESFTFYEYECNPQKTQLLFILFLIYDYQNNLILAKRCLEKFCQAFPEISSVQASAILKPLIDKYKDVTYDESENYSI